ncbi:Peptidase family M13 [Sphingomonas paucimobilis]|nr:Peptidase family M13 [Sphingomonas paucimobilis]
MWRRNYREANLRNRLLTDPHSPSQQRAWVVRNLDPWYAAYQPKSGEKLYLTPRTARANLVNRVGDVTGHRIALDPCPVAG